MLDLLLMRSFVTVINEGSFTRAANRLSLTQPAISGHLRRLESQVGKPLLRRTTRSFEVTPEGECLASYARAILALSRDAMAQISCSSLQNRLCLGVAEDFLTPRLLEVLRDYLASEPSVDVIVRVGIPGDMVEAMRQGHVDLVLGAQCGVSSEPGRLLWSEPLVWAWAAQDVQHPLPSPLPLALFPEPCPYREAALTQLAFSGIAQHTTVSCTSMASLQAAAKTGFAVAPMPASQLTPGLMALTPEHGLPELPDTKYMLMTSSAGDQEILTTLSDRIIEGLAGPEVAGLPECSGLSDCVVDR